MACIQVSPNNQQCGFISTADMLVLIWYQIGVNLSWTSGIWIIYWEYHGLWISYSRSNTPITNHYWMQAISRCCSKNSCWICMVGYVNNKILPLILLTVIMNIHLIASTFDIGVQQPQGRSSITSFILELRLNVHMSHPHIILFICWYISCIDKCNTSESFLIGCIISYNNM